MSPFFDGVHQGRIYFGWTNVWMQGGVNEKGLAYDIMALSPKQWERPPADRIHEPGRLALIRRIMESCATVEEALELKELEAPLQQDKRPQGPSGS